MRTYTCEVVGCSNQTYSSLCESHSDKLHLGFDSIMCGKCGTVIYVSEKRIRGKMGEVKVVDECYVCKGKVRRVKYPWEP